MLYNLRTSLSYRRFRQLTRGILDTPPVPSDHGPCTVVSMLCHRDVQMYLLALKSFRLAIGPAAVRIIDDGSLTQEDRAILQQHLPGVSILHLADIDPGACQRGGTWERLLHIIDLSQDGYVIQLDADTLTTGPVAEIGACIADNRPFVLSYLGMPVLPFAASANLADSIPSRHIIAVAERRFRDYPNRQAYRYVRGSSGFTGFARGHFSRTALEAFHGTMTDLVGDRWTEWGSEQVGSNFMLANDPDTLVLPFPKYLNYIPETYQGASSFFHFIGTYRFADQYYAKRGREIIARLQAGDGATA